MKRIFIRISDLNLFDEIFVFPNALILLSIFSAFYWKILCESSIQKKISIEERVKYNIKSFWFITSTPYCLWWSFDYHWHLYYYTMFSYFHIESFIEYWLLGTWKYQVSIPLTGLVSAFTGTIFDSFYKTLTIG